MSLSTAEFITNGAVQWTMAVDWVQMTWSQPPCGFHISRLSQQHEWRVGWHTSLWIYMSCVVRKWSGMCAFCSVKRLPSLLLELPRMHRCLLDSEDSEQTMWMNSLIWAFWLHIIGHFSHGAVCFISFFKEKYSISKLHSILRWDFIIHSVYLSYCDKFMY